MERTYAERTKRREAGAPRRDMKRAQIEMWRGHTERHREGVRRYVERACTERRGEGVQRDVERVHRET